MISIVRQFSNNVSLPYAYCIAGQLIVFNEVVESLSAFKVDSDKNDYPHKSVFSEGLDLKGFESLSQFELLTSFNSELCYRGRAQFDQKMRSILYWRSDNMAQIDVDGVPACRVDFHSKCIVILNEQSFDTPFNLELITGPALILLLAQRSIFCMHAGAVSFSESRGRVFNVAFLADSGVGKSTLSKGMGRDWSQVCDDILPLRMAEFPELFGDFPQLKLHQARVSNKSIKNNSLSCFIILDSTATESIVIERMSVVDSVLSVVRHTIASRLFDQDLMRAHIQFAKHIAQTVPVMRLNYPRDLALLPELRSIIINAVSNLND